MSKYYSKRIRAIEKQFAEDIAKRKEQQQQKKLVFQVDRPMELIHRVSAMTITRNNDNTFNVFFSVDWFRDSTQCTEYDYKNVPKEYVYGLVTGPSWTGNDTTFAHKIDVEKLKQFIL